MIFLAQSDTTIGFLGRDALALNALKGRERGQKILIELASLELLKQRVRVPGRFKNRVRRARRCTFIYPKNQQAFRVVQDARHLRFLRHFGWLYSTSANLTGQDFNLQWARGVSDVIIQDARGLKSASASEIYFLGSKRLKKIR